MTRSLCGMFFGNVMVLVINLITGMLVADALIVAWVGFLFSSAVLLTTFALIDWLSRRRRAGGEG